MIKKYSFVLLIALSFSLVGCGGDGNSPDDSTDQAAQEAKVQATATCGNQVCTQDQYCFQSVKDDTTCDNSGNCQTTSETILYSDCMPRPSSCDSCDCAQKDAMAQESGMCQSGMGCEQNSAQDNDNAKDAIKVSCYPYP
jgi:predicted small lipoprotein YifL